MEMDSPGDDVNLLGPELKVVDPLEDDVPARDRRRVRQLVVEERVRRGDHRGALDAPHHRILKERKGGKTSKIVHSPLHSNLNPEDVLTSSTLKSLV